MPADAPVETLGLEITHDVISISTPGSQIFAGNQTLSVGLARLLNEVGDPRYPKTDSGEADDAGRKKWVAAVCKRVDQ